MKYLWVMAFVMLAGCARSEIGEACETPGSTDECVDGALCTKEGDLIVCRKICNDQMDCPDGYNCSGTTGSLKSCQPI